MKKCLLGVLFCCCSALANADVSYTNFGVGIVDGDIFGRGADGFDLRGSFGFLDNFHAYASFQTLDTRINIPGVGVIDADVDRFDIGGGYHRELVQDLDFVATFGIVDFDNGNGSSDGIQASAGVRGSLDNYIEYSVEAVYENLDDIDSDTGLQLGARYYLTRFNSVGLTIRDVGGFDLVRLDFRFDY